MYRWKLVIAALLSLSEPSSCVDAGQKKSDMIVRLVEADSILGQEDKEAEEVACSGVMVRPPPKRSLPTWSTVSCIQVARPPSQPTHRRPASATRPELSYDRAPAINFLWAFLPSSHSRHHRLVEWPAGFVRLLLPNWVRIGGALIRLLPRQEKLFCPGS